MANRFTVEQIELIRRLRNSGISRDQLLDAFDRLDRLDDEFGDTYTRPVTSVARTQSPHGNANAHSSWNSSSNSGQSTSSPKFVNGVSAAAHPSPQIQTRPPQSPALPVTGPSLNGCSGTVMKHQHYMPSSPNGIQRMSQPQYFPTSQQRAVKMPLILPEEYAAMPRRERFTFRPCHLEILERSFREDMYPSYEKRDHLANLCNDAVDIGREISERERVYPNIVCNWFANKRKDLKQRLSKEMRMYSTPDGFQYQMDTSQQIIVDPSHKSSQPNTQPLQTHATSLQTHIPSPQSHQSPLQSHTVSPQTSQTLEQTIQKIKMEVSGEGCSNSVESDQYVSEGNQGVDLVYTSVTSPHDDASPHAQTSSPVFPSVSFQNTW